ncbi:hypothetical protein [Aliagarivorans marinus]|uniref:hypothetical protein n=1 Tax=Aliagarivorans marinus TaxID=561965 RepID=UPI00040A836D|nr:hypothetical protein [Aliagarivorans marinus]
MQFPLQRRYQSQASPLIEHLYQHRFRYTQAMLGLLLLIVLALHLQQPNTSLTSVLLSSEQSAHQQLLREHLSQEQWASLTLVLGLLGLLWLLVWTRTHLCYQVDLLGYNQQGQPEGALTIELGWYRKSYSLHELLLSEQVERWWPAPALSKQRLKLQFTQRTLELSPDNSSDFLTHVGQEREQLELRKLRHQEGQSSALQFPKLKVAFSGWSKEFVGGKRNSYLMHLTSESLDPLSLLHYSEDLFTNQCFKHGDYDFPADQPPTHKQSQILQELNYIANEFPFRINAPAPGYIIHSKAHGPCITVCWQHGGLSELVCWHDVG